MYKIAVMGDRESVMGFKALGLETVFPESTQEARKSLQEMAEQDYAIVYVTEAIAEALAEDIKKYSYGTKPAIIPIPGREGSRGLGMAALKTYVEKAVGSDIL